MNILLTSAGKRNYLVQFFRTALDGNGRVFAADAAEDAPAFEDADVRCVLPPFSDNSYLPTLIDLCRQHRIGLVIPLNDVELEIIAEAAPRLRSEAGTRAVVSSTRVLQICFDKVATARFLSEIGLRTVPTWDSVSGARYALRNRELQFPAVVKPRWGSGSIGLVIAHNDEEMEFAVRWSERAIRASVLAGKAALDPEHAMLVQQMIRGPEYGFDVVNDLDGNYVATLSRRKLAMRAGETDKAVTTVDAELEQIGRRIGSALRHVGVLDCDALHGPDGWVVLEMNPRFGGGYPFNHAAGANVPAALVAWAEGRKADPVWLQYKPGVVSTKTHRIVTARFSSSLQS